MSSETDVTGLMTLLLSNLVKTQNSITESISEKEIVSSETDVTGLMILLFSDVTMKQNISQIDVSKKSSSKVLEATNQGGVVKDNFRINEIELFVAVSILKPQLQDIGYSILQSSDIIILNHD